MIYMYNRETGGTNETSRVIREGIEMGGLEMGGCFVLSEWYQRSETHEVGSESF
jgi:hypothetical protein